MSLIFIAFASFVWFLNKSELYLIFIKYSRSSHTEGTDSRQITEFLSNNEPIQYLIDLFVKGIVSHNHS